MNFYLFYIGTPICMTSVSVYCARHCSGNFIYFSQKINWDF